MKIAFIGGGNMATSLIGGLVGNEFISSEIWVSDPSQEKLNALANKFAVNITTSNDQAIAAANIVVLAVKPQILPEVCRSFGVSLEGKLCISIAAGINCALLNQILGEQIAVVRAMPNTPSLLQRGATGLYANAYVTEAQRKQAHVILDAVGYVAWVEQETLIDAVTATSGSGPAYFFLLMEAMIDAAIELGLESETATQLVLQTAAGAAAMAQQSSVDVAELRQRVTSKGGTTEQAILSFENNQFRRIVAEALQAACSRSQQLAEQLQQSS